MNTYKIERCSSGKEESTIEEKVVAVIELQYTYLLKNLLQMSESKCSAYYYTLSKYVRT
ncbi:hypothetical protein PM738_17195 [Erysipelatoclostridium ramosum]|uniref:Uncharacterized protein n=1 Tax=Thomasclavelia ramosa TaxID=1547 RepID=A0AB35IQQ8_9FIRM|nr:hypothetical protein [Thomasclavelia ramosa]MDB7085540.1 hypothetical protein [Thomasclavelia ramosa]